MDSAPGDVNGNGRDRFGAEWYAVQPSGEKAGASDESSEESSSGGSTDDPSTSGVHTGWG